MIYMMGAIIGDIVGSRFEWHNIKTKDFDLFHEDCCFTDDTVATIAVAKGITNSFVKFSKISDSDRPKYYFQDNYFIIDYIGRTVKASLQEIGREYLFCGWGGKFLQEWLLSDDPKPYNSWGNGAAMRISSVAWVAHSCDRFRLMKYLGINRLHPVYFPRGLDNCIRMSKAVTEITHNHPEGIKGAEALAVCTYLALNGKSKNFIREYVNEHYYRLDFTLDEIRPSFSFDVSCQGTVPPAIVAFLESNSFEDAIRNAVSIGGDSDTLAACTGAIAEAFYGIPNQIRETAASYLDDRLLDYLTLFEKAFPPKTI